MANHLHAVIEPYEINRRRSRRRFLRTSRANGWSRRDRFSGRSCRGLYRAEGVEIEACL
jgi:hypothetical protein